MQRLQRLLLPGGWTPRHRAVGVWLQRIPKRLHTFPQTAGVFGQLLLGHSGAKALPILRGKLLVKGLSGCFGQLMRFVYDQHTVIPQQRALALFPPDGIGQQVIVVAYLNRHRRPHGSLQIVLIPAGIPIGAVSRTDSRNAHQRTVECRQPLDGVQIDLLVQCGHDGPLLAVIPRFAVDLPGAFFQAAVADKAFLAFSHHSTQRLADDAARQQGGRQKWQIFLNDGRLQGHAAGGNHH